VDALLWPPALIFSFVLAAAADLTSSLGCILGRGLGIAISRPRRGSPSSSPDELQMSSSS
jgi:hypothetical protein